MGIVATDSIRISYRPLLNNPFPERTRHVHSIAEFARRESQGGRTSDGIYEKLISFTDLEFGGDNPIEAFLQFGNMLLTNHAWPVIDGTFDCLSINYVQWTAGQTFRMISEAFNIFDLEQWVIAGGPDTDPVKQSVLMYVKSISITPLSTDVLQYKIGFSNRAGDV